MIPEPTPQAETPDISPDVLALLDKHDSALAPPASGGDGASLPPSGDAKPAASVVGTEATPVAPPADLKPFEDRFAQLQDEKTKLAERAKELEVREAALPNVDAFKRDAISEIRRLAAAVVGDDEGKIGAFLAQEIYEPLMVEVLGMKDPDKLDPAIRLRADQRRLERALHAEKQAREESQRALQQKDEETAHQAKLQQIKGTLTRWIEGKASDYPHLMKYSSRAADDVFEILLENERLTPEQAAELAEKHYRKERERYSDQVPDGKQIAAAGTQATKSGQSATRATSLTNSGATEGTATAGDSPPDDPDASARYWADRLEKDPEGMKRMIARRR